MPENQSQPRTGGYGNPRGEPRLSPQPDAPKPERPSDVEAAHDPEEGASVRDPRLQTDEARSFAADENHADQEGRSGRDRREDYGAQGMKGTDRGTAGGEFADRLQSIDKDAEKPR